MTGFTVDTHLFRELGELLVGRESTALIELVKNAYDADANEVVVFGDRLSDPQRGVIRISDNGIGMNPETFVRGFLRVASRLRDTGSRTSIRWGRRYTGAKGVGRLSAHKLARRIDIQSIPWRSNGNGSDTYDGVEAFIDWDEVEKAETLDAISEAAVGASPRPSRRGDHHGTTLTLSRLRQKWTKYQLSRFLVEVEGLRAPKVLCDPLPRRVVDRPLIDQPLVVDASSKDPGFTVRLEGEFEVGDNYWPAVLDAASWVLEIDASPKSVRYGMAPTRRTLRDLGNVRPQTFSEPHPASDSGPFFQARILVREGAPTGGKDERGWASRVSGIRVYMEGFRVLPYGEDADDWLSLSRDTTERTRKLRFLTDSVAASRVQEVDEEGLLLLPNKHYFGAVFLTGHRSGSLHMLVNREGFVPNVGFETLILIVRRGVDLATRVRAAAKASASLHALSRTPETNTSISQKTPRGAGELREPSLRRRAEGSLERLAAQAAELRALAIEARPPLSERLLATAAEIVRAAQLSRELIPATSMVLVLASVGTQLAAFTHEVNRLLALASDVEAAALRARDYDIPAKLQSQLAKVAAGASDLRRAIERQAAYLLDVITPDARRRRSRQRVREGMDVAWQFVAAAAEQRGISFRNEVDGEHKTPPLFRAELMAILTNLFTNAVKAAGRAGAIRAASAILEDGTLSIRLENTGAAVDLDEAERWFAPFESTTLDVDPVLGQGMGLGLGITRDLLAEVGATIGFVSPRRGFATAVEVVFPGGDER